MCPISPCRKRPNQMGLSRFPMKVKNMNEEIQKYAKPNYGPLPVFGLPVQVQCDGFKCMAFRDKEGRWVDFFQPQTPAAGSGSGSSRLRQRCFQARPVTPGKACRFWPICLNLTLDRSAPRWRGPERFAEPCRRHEGHPGMIPQEPPQSREPARTQTTRPPGATELIYRRLFEATESPGKLSANLPRGSETILLVEDTSWLRELLQRVLRTCGYTVLEAAHGEAAIQLAGTYQGTVHLFVSDPMLPGICGCRLAGRIGALKPGIRLLYISGYTADALLRHGMLASEAAFLQKPFSPGALAFKVREVLALMRAKRLGVRQSSGALRRPQCLRG